MRRVLGVVVVPAFVVALAASSEVPAAAAVDPAVVAAMKKVKASDYPSANTVAIVDSQAVVFQPDGQFTNTMRSVTMALTPEGKAEASSATIYYTRDAEKVEVLTAQVVKADGSAVPVPAKDIQDTEQSGEMNIYDPVGRAVKITFAGLAVGDAVEVSYKLTRLTPTRDNYWNDQFWFQTTVPILDASYTVDGPASMPLTAQIYHPERGAKVAASKQKVGDRVHYAWTAHDAPQLVPEPAMSFSQEVPILVVTTDPSWQHFSTWWAQLTEKQMEVTPEIKAKVAELTKDAKTDEQKIKALYDFVSANVRYRGLGVGPRTGYTPRKAHDTMTSRWGVCRDVSILLTTMLRVDGFEAFPVLTNVGDRVLPKVAYDGFNHAIVAMPRKDGGWTYLDPTAKNNSELIPGSEGEQSTLVSTTKGEPLTAIPPVDPAANRGHVSAVSAIGADGALTSKVTFDTKGMFDMIVRSWVATTSKDQQRQGIEQLIHAALPDATIVSYDTTSALALFTPMQVTLEIKLPGAAVKTGDYRLLRTLVTSGALGLVEDVLPQMLGGLATRKFGLDAQMTLQYDEDETVTLPADMKVVALPNEAHADSKVSSLVSACTQGANGALACHRSFALKSRFIDPARYGELRDALASLGRIARQPIVLAGGK
jgi:transglutaminase-like putative cysteine protease